MSKKYKKEKILKLNIQKNLLLVNYKHKNH